MAEVRSAAILAQAMVGARLSAAELGRRVGVSRSRISRLTTGARSYCSAPVAAAIAEALEQDPGALFVLETVPSRTATVSGQDIAS